MVASHSTGSTPAESPQGSSRVPPQEPPGSIAQSPSTRGLKTVLASLPPPATDKPRLPVPVQFIYEQLFEALHAPDDTLFDRQRKLLIGWGFVASFTIPMIVAYVVSVMIRRTGFVAGTALFALGMLICGISFVSAFVYVRRTKKAPEWLIDAMLFTNSLAVLLDGLAVVEYPSTVLVLVLAQLSALCYTRRLPLHLLVHFAMYCTLGLNPALAGYAREGLIGSPYWSSLAVVPQAYWCTPGERISLFLFGLFISCCCAALTAMHIVQSHRASVQQAASLRLTRHVVMQLIRFDTDEAAARLVALRTQSFDSEGEYIPPLSAMADKPAKPSLRPPHGNRKHTHAGAAGADEDLQSDLMDDEGSKQSPGSSMRDSFGTGTTPNSERMTPVPSPTKAAVAVDTDNASASSEDSAPDPALTVNVDAALVDAFAMLVRHMERFRPHLPNWLLSVAQSQGQRLATVVGEDGEGAQREGSSLLDNAEDEGELSSVSSSVTESSSPRGGSYRQGQSLKKTDSSHSAGSDMPLNSGSLFRQRRHRVSMATVDFHCLVPPDPATMGTTADPLCCFIDAVNEAADATYAAVHAFVGDSIVASWNTVRHTAQVECKAGRFFAALREAARQHDGAVRLGGAAMTGEACVQFAGISGKGHQHALVVSLPAWRRAFRQLVCFGREVGALVVDETTYKAASYTVEGRIVDFVTVAKVGSNASSGYGSGTSSVPFGLGFTGALRPSTHNTGAPNGNSPGAGDTRTMPVYEILRDLSASKQDKAAGIVTGERPEEWMYTLSGAERTTTVAIKEAIELAQDGKFVAARDHLRTSLRAAAEEPTPLPQAVTEDRMASSESLVSDLIGTPVSNRRMSSRDPNVPAGVPARLLKKLELFAAEARPWASFPEDLTRYL